MKWWQLVAVALIFLALGYFVGQSRIPPTAQTSTPVPKQPTNAPTTSVSSPTPTAQTPTNITSAINPLPTAGGGPQNDIIEIQQISPSQPVAQIGDDITFSVTIKNQAPYKKFIQAICFNSSDGNFGCAQGKNLGPGEVFNINNSGRFKTSGIKSVWITWTQDNQTYFRPVNAGSATITIQ